MIKCPYCGESDFYELYHTSTLVNYPAHYKDGKRMPSGENIVTHYYSCVSCGMTFTSDKSPLDDATRFGVTNLADLKINGTGATYVSDTDLQTDTKIEIPVNTGVTSDLESRIARLEEQVSRLENSGWKCICT